MYTYHTKCRACGYGKPTLPYIKAASTSEKLMPVFDLGLHPLANDFRKDGEEHAGFAPLAVLFCPRCTLAQLSVVVNPAVLYSHYSYVTSKSDTMRAHFNALWAALSSEAQIHSVIEIGSNDGHFLGFALNKGALSVGIDPAKNLTDISKQNYPSAITICGMFDSSTAMRAKEHVQHADLILARHVFCHMDDWHAFFVAADKLAGAETRIVIEAPYAVDTLRKIEFDQIYFEHLSFLSLRSITSLLSGTPFRIHQVLHFDIHGGTIAVVIRRKDSQHDQTDAARRMLDDENITMDSWTTFAECSKHKIEQLKAIVLEGAGNGKSVCGFGASAKSTVWMTMCNFTKKHIRFICDNTPQKQYTYSPGTDVPITDEGALLRELPNYAVMFCWNFADEVIQKQQRYIELGGKFIVPVEDMKIIP